MCSRKWLQPEMPAVSSRAPDLVEAAHPAEQVLVPAQGIGAGARRLTLHDERAQEPGAGARQLLIRHAFRNPAQLADEHVDGLLAALRRRAGVGQDKARA